MSTEELFQAIEDICGFDDSISLLDRICEILEIHEESEELPVNQTKVIENEEAADAEKIETQDKFNPFYIEKTDQVIDVKTGKDFTLYKWKIMEIKELTAFTEKYKSKIDTDSSIKLISKMVDTIKKMDSEGKRTLFFYKEKDNSERLAKYVQEKILKKHIKQISTSCYKEIFKTDKPEKYLLELANVVHSYLKNLGVYTVVAQAGRPYDEVINFYEIICDPEKRNKKPVITQIEYPAYVIEYIDEDGEQQSYCVQGKCVVE